MDAQRTVPSFCSDTFRVFVPVSLRDKPHLSELVKYQNLGRLFDICQ